MSTQIIRKNKQSEYWKFSAALLIFHIECIFRIGCTSSNQNYKLNSGSKVIKIWIGKRIALIWALFCSYLKTCSGQGCQIVSGHFTTEKIQLHYFYTTSTLHQKYTKNFQFHRLITLGKSFKFEIHRKLHYREVKVQNF